MEKSEIKELVIILAIIAFTSLVFVFLIMSDKSDKQNSKNGSQSEDIIVMEGKSQVINITAKSGYNPSKVFAKGNIPTIINMISKNAYGCERAFTIPSLKIDKVLQTNGEERFDVGTFKSGDTLFGSCSMGMYTFEISFE